MTEQEACQLLSLVASVAPHDMRAQYHFVPKDLHRVTFRIGFDDHAFFEFGDDDLVDSSGSVAMMQAINKRGFITNLIHSDGAYTFEIQGHGSGTGDTISEAVSRAFISFFGEGGPVCGEQGGGLRAR